MKIELLEKSRAKLTFTVTPAEFDHALEHAYAHKKDEVEIKGFRKGHVPQSVYETNFGVESLYSDALNHTVGHLFEQALADESLKIVSEPTNVDFDVNSLGRGKTFEITFEVDLEPEVTLGQYKGIKIAKIESEVTDEEVLQEVNNLAQKNAESLPKETGALEHGDTAIFDFKGFVDGVAFEGGEAENHSLEIGSNQFIPGFESGMVGMNLGESRDVKVTFPTEYHEPSLAGKEAVFNVKLNEIKVLKAATVNDEWAASLNEENVTNLSELKASILKRLKEQKLESAKQQKEREVLAAIVANAQITLHQSMIDREAARLTENVKRQAAQYNLDLETYLGFMGMNLELFEKSAKEQAAIHLKERLVLEKIAATENFEFSEEEINAKFEEIALSNNVDVETVKKHVPKKDLIINLGIIKSLELIIKEAIEE